MTRHRSIIPNQTFLTNLVSLPLEDQQWLTGFWEGDGSIVANREGRLRLYFYNKDLGLLQYIKDTLGLSQRISLHNVVWQIEVASQNQALPLLVVLCEYLICPHRAKQITTVSSKCGYSLSPTIHDPSIPGFVGFWDAEGSSYCGNWDLKLSISQSDHTPLEGLRLLLNGGKVSLDGVVHSLNFHGGAARGLVPHILRYSKHQEKRGKLIAALYYLSTYSPTYKEFYKELTNQGYLR